MMTSNHVLVAGWPFAGLLTLDTRRADGSVRSGVVTEHGDDISLLLLEPGAPTDVIKIGVATALYGLDGYPISPEAINIGDHAEVVLEKCGSAWTTVAIHLLPLI
jgi:hypothetical protein